MPIPRKRQSRNTQRREGDRSDRGAVAFPEDGVDVPTARLDDGIRNLNVLEECDDRWAYEHAVREDFVRYVWWLVWLR